VNTYLLAENDIVIARTGGTIGKSFLIKSIPLKSLFASYLIRVIPSIMLNATYLKRFLESPEYWKQLYDAAWGAGQPNVNGTALSRLVVPLAPFSEQSVIVETSNRFMATIDQLQKQVSDRKEQSELLMQSVLREAFEHCHE
jgi:restriction endonuclease S subunit